MRARCSQYNRAGKSPLYLFMVYGGKENERLFGYRLLYRMSLAVFFLALFVGFFKLTGITFIVAQGICLHEYDTK